MQEVYTSSSIFLYINVLILSGVQIVFNISKKVYSKSPYAITVYCHAIKYCLLLALFSDPSTYKPTSVFEGHSNKPIHGLVFQGKERNEEEHLLL